MCHANNEKWKMVNHGRNRNQEKYQNRRRKGNLQIFGNIESERHQANGDERKN